MVARWGCVALAGALVLSGCGGSGGSGGGGGGGGTGGTAVVRFLHNSPDAGTVTARVGRSDKVVLQYKQFSNVYYTIDASSSTSIGFRDADDGRILVTQAFPFERNKAYLISLNGKAAGAPALTIVRAETRTTDLPADQYQFRVLHASPANAATRVDVYVTPPTTNIGTVAPQVTNVAYGSMTDYVTLPATVGTRIRVTLTGAKTPLVFDGTFTGLTGPHRTLTFVVYDKVGTAPNGQILIDHTNP